MPIKVDLYTDAYLGDWKPCKKLTNKASLGFKREKTLTLAREYAIRHFDADNKQWVYAYGELTLVEKKVIDKNTSVVSLFRDVEYLPGTLKEVVI